MLNTTDSEQFLFQGTELTSTTFKAKEKIIYVLETVKKVIIIYLIIG